MWLAAIGVVLAGLGALGVLFAPAMIEARREAGKITDHEGITDDDRILVTRGMGAVFLVVGLLLTTHRLFG